MGEEALAQLAFRYGHASRAVLDLAREDPKLARPIVAGRPDLLAEVAIAARREQARSVADVLLRRTRLGILAAPQLRDADRRSSGRRGRSAPSWAGRGGGSSRRRRPGRRRPRRRASTLRRSGRLNNLPLR